MDAFVAAGGTFFDTADIYSRWIKGHGGGESETIIGRWLKERGGRERLVIATKVRGRMWMGPSGEGLGREHIVKSCEQSLRRLQTDVIDLYQAHWADEATPLEETIRAFEDLVRAGKVRAVGVSNHNPDELDRFLAAAANAGLSVATLQPHYNLVYRAEYEAALMPRCLRHGLSVIPYSPLAKGFLTGRYERGKKAVGARANGLKQYLSDGAWETLAAVREIARDHEVATAAVALAWLLGRPGVTAPIAGASTVAQLAEQLAATDLVLTPAERDRLDRTSAASAGTASPV